MWHGFRILTHNPEVLGSNPLPPTNENHSPWGYVFLIPKGAQSEGLRVDGYEKSLFSLPSGSLIPFFYIENR